MFCSKGLSCPATYNAAEFYVSQLAIRPGREERSARQISWLCDQFADSPEGDRLRTAVQDSEAPLDGPCAVKWKQTVSDLAAVQRS